MDDGMVDIIHEGCDAGIRLRESVSNSMIAVPIRPDFDMAVVGSPAYFGRDPVPETPADLNSHNGVRYRHTSSGASYCREFTDPDQPHRDLDIEPNATFTTNDETMVRAALPGAGLA